MSYLATYVAMSFLSQGELTRIQDTSIICPGDVAVYQCTVVDSSLEWELYLLRDPRSIVFRNSEPVGDLRNETLGSSPVSAQLIFNNGTSLTSTLSLQVSLHLNGTNVECGGNTLTLNIRCKYHYYYHTVAIFFCSM